MSHAADRTPGDAGIDRSPALASTAIATGFALLAVVVLPTTAAFVVGVVGAVVASGSVVIGAHSRLDHGVVLLVGGVAIAGVQGSPPEPLVLATLCGLLAWDTGHYGIRIGRQLGREADTVQIELAHAAVTAAIGAAGAGLGYATYRVLAGGQPAGVPVLLVSGAVLLVVALR